jgi:integrase
MMLERALMGGAYNEHDLCFAREDGAPIHPALLTQAFAKHVASAGLPTIRLHDLRHTHATLALVSGVPVHVVSARLGHSSPSITLNVYSHLLPTSDESAAERVAELVRG